MKAGCKTTHSSAWAALFSNEGWLQNDAQQCVGTAPPIQRPAANQEGCHSPFAIRHLSFVICH